MWKPQGRNKAKVQTRRMRIEKAFKEHGMPIFEPRSGGAGVSIRVIKPKRF